MAVFFWTTLRRLASMDQEVDSAVSLYRGRQKRGPQGPRFGEFCFCSWLPLMPGHPRVVLSTWGPKQSLPPRRCSACSLHQRVAVPRAVGLLTSGWAQCQAVHTYIHIRPANKTMSKTKIAVVGGLSLVVVAVVVVVLILILRYLNGVGKRDRT